MKFCYLISRYGNETSSVQRIPFHFPIFAKIKYNFEKKNGAFSEMYCVWNIVQLLSYPEQKNDLS